MHAGLKVHYDSPYALMAVMGANVNLNLVVGGLLLVAYVVTIVATTGRPGAAPSVILRAPTSITASGRGQGPLYIVDGVILSGATPDINPNDIESIEVVKGAAAASLYGARAGGGVINMKTKSGRGAREGVTFGVRAEYGVTTIQDGDEVEIVNFVGGGSDDSFTYADLLASVHEDDRKRMPSRRSPLVDPAGPGALHTPRTHDNRIEGDFPNYEQLIPGGYPNRLMRPWFGPESLTGPLPDGVTIDRPIQLMFVTTGAQTTPPPMTSTRVLIVAGESAQAQVVPPTVPDFRSLSRSYERTL